jgi:hypothetical protein
VEGFALSGAGLNRPVQIPRVVLAPEQETGSAANSEQKPANESGEATGVALEGTVTLPAGGTVPLAIGLRLARSGYEVTLRGQANLERARELMRAAGVAGPAGLDAMAGEPLALDLRAQGAWLPAETAPPETANLGDGFAAPAADSALADSLSGTVTLRDANWKAQFLAHGVEITEATLHLGNGEYRWDPVEFTYGPVKGTASLEMPASCAGPAACPPQFEMHFGNLDAATLETAILGVRQQGTLLSDLIEKIHPESAPAWPELEGSVSAESLVLGPVTLRQPQAQLRVEETGAEITHLEAGLLGGKLEGKGEFDRAASSEDKPAYAFDCKLDGASAQAVGRLIGETWSGGTLKASGAVKLEGYTDSDLASSAVGKVHVEWRHGTVTAKSAAGAEPATGTGTTAATSSAGTNPAPPRRFDLWVADASIRDGAITLGASQVHAEGRSYAVSGTIDFGNPVTASFSTGDAARLHGPAPAGDGQAAPEGGDAPRVNQ